MYRQSQICGKLKRSDIATGLVHVQSPGLVPLPILDHGDGIIRDPGLTVQGGVLAPDVDHLLEGEAPLDECRLLLDTREAEVLLDVGDVHQHLCLEVVAHHLHPDHRHHLLRSNPKEFLPAHHVSHAAHLHLLVLHEGDIDSLHHQVLHRKGVPHLHSSHYVQESLEGLFHLLILQHQSTKL